VIHLLNGTTQARVKSSDDVTVYPCGCAYNDVMWLQMCDPHYQADSVYRAAAQEDRAIRSLTEELT
jgi:hypothetical protein